MKYYRRTEMGKTEEIDQETFIQGLQSEFMYGRGYYEHMLILLGMGERMIGSIHMYWVKND
jgi:hypothetical protein